MMEPSDLNDLFARAHQAIAKKEHFRRGGEADCHYIRPAVLARVEQGNNILELDERLYLFLKKYLICPDLASVTRKLDEVVAIKLKELGDPPLPKGDPKEVESDVHARQVSARAAGELHLHCASSDVTKDALKPSQER